MLGSWMHGDSVKLQAARRSSIRLLFHRVQWSISLLRMDHEAVGAIDLENYEERNICAEQKGWSLNN
jgi:hypothetical protein